MRRDTGRQPRRPHWPALESRLVHSRMKTVGFGDTPEEAGAALEDHIHAAHAVEDPAELKRDTRNQVDSHTTYERQPGGMFGSSSPFHGEDPQHTHEFIAELRDALDEGLSFRQVAAEMDMDSRGDREWLAGVIRYLRKNGMWTPNYGPEHARREQHARRQSRDGL